MSDTINAMQRLAEESLTEKEAELEKVAGPLVEEIKELKSVIKKVGKKGGTTSSAPATSDEDLLAAVTHCSQEGPAKSSAIAKFLGVDPRSISRRLSAWGAEGKISGNKEEGYSAS